MNTKTPTDKPMNTNTRHIRTPHLMITVVLLFCCGVTPGGKFMAQQNENRPSPDKVAVTLHAESSELQKKRPCFVTVTIKNLSAEAFDLTDSVTLRLEKSGQTEEAKKKVGPNFYTWISLDSELPDSDIKRRGTLLQGEEVSLRLELSQRKWGHSILSGYPSKSVYLEIPDGQYDLFVDVEVMEGNKGTKVRSGVLSIRVS
jgi:hypothetical protein